MPNKEDPDWPYILERLALSDIDFVVVGGAALVLHGIPRTTILISISHQKAQL